MNIEEIEAREKAAAKGPWTPSTILHLALKDDVDFAAHARSDIPDLLAELREAREERDVAQETVVALLSVAQERDEAREKLEAVGDYRDSLLCPCRDILDTVVVARELDRILKGGE